MAIAPVGVSLSVDYLQDEDPTASIPLDTSPTGTAPSDSATVDLNVPTTLPANSVVTLTIDPSLAQAISVYSDAACTVPLLGNAANGRTSYSWTIGSDTFPTAMYAVALQDGGWDASMFKLTVTVPTRVPPSMATSSQNPAGGSGGGSPGRSVTATQPAATPPPGFFAAFDGTWDYANDKTSGKGTLAWPSGTLIAEFARGYQISSGATKMSPMRAV